MDSIEKQEIYGLSLYDMNRTPRRLIPEFFVDSEGKLMESKVRLSINALKELFRDEFKCPICLDTLDKTWTVSACLHRFCSECLHRSLRTDLGPKMHHECPSCRAKMASRRASKPDSNIDELIITFLKKGKKIHSDQLGEDSDEGANMDEIFKYSVDIDGLKTAHKVKIESFKRKSEQLYLESQRTDITSKRSKTFNSRDLVDSSNDLMVNLSIFPWPDWTTEVNKYQWLLFIIIKSILL